jgi:act minimal PKS ketosynthase (KS/KS alpha)
MRLLQEGSADLVLAGAAEAPISPITSACFDAIKATSPDNDDPAGASRPFDLNRHGFVLGEGAAVLVLERLADARDRGARVYAEIIGFASRSNAFHMTGLQPDGREMAEAIRRAMAEAAVGPGDIDYINAHGSGARQNDRHETAAFKRSLGVRAYEVPVSSIKSMIGHSLGAIGSIEVAACALTLDQQVVPPTANLQHARPRVRSGLCAADSPGPRGTSNGGTRPVRRDPRRQRNRGRAQRGSDATDERDHGTLGPHLPL